MAITTLEIDVNTGDSVKSLSDLKREFKDIQNQLTGLTPGTEEYVNALKKLGAVKDEIGDLKDQIQGFAGADKKIAAVTSVVGGLASGFQAAQGAAAIFGSESENLEKTLLRIQAVMAFTQGIQGIAQLGDSLSVLGNVIKSTEIGAKAAAVAQRIWNAAVNAFGGPIGAVIAALTALVGVIALFVAASEDETEAMKESIKQREKELDLMNKTAEALKSENKYRLDLAAAQGKSAEELAKINEQNAQSEIKSIDARIQKLRQSITERYALIKKSSGDELKELVDLNSKNLEEMQKLANERLDLQRGLKIQEAKLETESRKEQQKEEKKDIKDFSEELRRLKEDLDAQNIQNEEQKQLRILELSYQRERKELISKGANNDLLLALDLKYFNDRADIENKFIDAEEKRKKDEKDAREKEYQEAIALRDKQLDEEDKKAAEKRKEDKDAEKLKQENLKKAKEQEVQLTLQGLTAIQGLADAFAGKSTESQKRAFQIKKAASLAQATIETYQAAQSAYASQMTIPTPDAPIRANIAAAIAIASGLARVAVIAKTKFEGGGATASGGSGGGNLGTFTQGGGGQPPQGLTAQNTVTQLNPDGTVASQGQRQAAPMKAYVVESESRAVTERVNKLSNNSKIG